MYKPDTWYAEGNLVFLTKANGKMTRDANKQLVEEVENAISFNIWHSHNLPVDKDAQASVHQMAAGFARILNGLGVVGVKSAGQGVPFLADLLDLLQKIGTMKSPAGLDWTLVSRAAEEKK
jgi:hypothetical protein